MSAEGTMPAWVARRRDELQLLADRDHTLRPADSAQYTDWARAITSEWTDQVST